MILVQVNECRIAPHVSPKHGAAHCGDASARGTTPTVLCGARSVPEFLLAADDTAMLLAPADGSTAPRLAAAGAVVHEEHPVHFCHLHFASHAAWFFSQVRSHPLSLRSGAGCI